MFRNYQTMKFIIFVYQFDDAKLQTFFETTKSLQRF